MNTNEKGYQLQDGGQTVLDYIQTLEYGSKRGWEVLLDSLPLPEDLSRDKVIRYLERYINDSYGGGYASGRPPEFFILVFGDKQKLVEQLIEARQRELAEEKEYKTKITHGKLSRYNFERLVKGIFKHYYPKFQDELIDTDGSPEGIYLSNRGKRLFHRLEKTIAEKSGMSLEEVHKQLENPMVGEWGRHLEDLMTDFYTT